MGTNLINSLDQSATVKRLILDPLEGRGEPPRGWTKQALAADYVLALGEYPAPVLEEAAKRVRLEHTRNTWPLAGDYLKVVKTLMGAEQPGTAHQADEVAERTARGYDYVHRRLMADESSLFLRAARCHSVRPLRVWLFERACICMRRGGDPYIPNPELEEKMIAWEAEWAEIKAGGEAAATTRSTFAAAAEQIVAQAQEAHEEELEP